MEISIGELSRRTHVKVPTIRYYESVALMPAPLRSEGKQRRYGEAEASRLTFIRHARELGFEIDAIRTLLALQDNPSQPCTTADRIARRALPTLSSGFTALRLSKPSWN
jgi:DNA-binding transcriptional MerR regulator